jgi:hypothetical protein
MTTPEQVRSGLQTVTTAAQAEVAAVTAATESPTATRAALFAAVPLIVNDYADGAAALALDWYEELREAAPATKAFTPQPFVLVTDDVLAGIVARTTKALHEIERGILRDVETAMAESIALLGDAVQDQVASGFRDTITENVTADPAAAGWRRFARPEACKFCLMLAARGAVYTEATARFAAHGAVMGTTTSRTPRVNKPPHRGGKRHGCAQSRSKS